MSRNHRSIQYIWHMTITVSVIVMSLISCKDKNENLVSLSYDPDSVPTLITKSASQLISDSGITRYKLVYEEWQIFDKAKDPYWYFPKGLYFEKFTPDFTIEATVVADTAWRYTAKDMWVLKKNVHVENAKGEQFDSDELYWDEKKGRVYSDAYIVIKTSDAEELKGYGFESNRDMTDYRIFRPHDAKMRFSESAPNDSLQSDLLPEPDNETEKEEN